MSTKIQTKYGTATIGNHGYYYISDNYDNKISKLEKEKEQLKQRNKRQYNQLVELWGLIENKNWETLTQMVKQMKEDEERLQKEWRCYE